MTALGLVVFAWAIAAAIWPLTGTVVPWDSKNHFYPMLRYLGAALANGELPLWNPYHFSGHPSVADPQSLLFTPTMLLFSWLVSSPSMQLFDLVIFAHFLPGALAIVALFRRRRWHSTGAIVAALIFILGGSASARLQHTGMIFSYGFFPLALWFLEEALDRRSYLFGIAFAIVAATMTVGRDQVAFLCALTIIGAAIYQLLDAPDKLNFLRSRLLLLIVMGIVGGILLAVPTVLTMQLLATSTRPSFGYGVAAMGSLPPSSLATIFFSNIFGSLRWTYDYWGPDWQSLAQTTWTDRATNYLFIGTIPGLLILWHGLAAGRLFAREFRFFLGVGVIAIVYALGHYTPIFVLVFDHFPAVDLYRRPADATFLINFTLAFASGYLVHRYLRDGAPVIISRWWRSLPTIAGIATTAVLFAVLLVVALHMAVSAHHLLDSLKEVSLGFALAALTVAAMLFRPAPRARRFVAAALVAITCGELIWRNAASSLNAEPAERYAVFQQLPPEQLQGLQLLRQELAERHSKGERPRVEILGLGGAWQNASMVLGLEDTIGYNPLRLSNYERAIGPGENAADTNLRQFPATFRGYRCELASLLGLEYLVLDRPAEQLPTHFPRLKNAKLLYGSGHMWIYRLSPPSPRAYLAEIVIPVDSDTALDQDDMPEFDRKSEALIDEGSLDQLRGTYTRDAEEPVLPPKPANNQVRIVDYNPNSVTLDVTSTNGGVLVLHDIFYPGWEVTVDGQPRPVLRANLLFRGVEVPLGRHRVEFRFRPLSIDNLVAAASDLVESKLGEAAESEPR